jgi:hypothetical protein
MWSRGFRRSCHHLTPKENLLDPPTPSPPSSLPVGEHLGSREPEHLSRWFAALIAGRQARQCRAIARSTGRPCRAPPRRHAVHCRVHCSPQERREADLKRLPEIERLLRRPLHPIPRANLEATANAIRRRALRREWRRDPTIPGATLALSPRDETRVRDFVLSEAGVRLDSLATARAVDRCMWAGALALAKRCTIPTARREIDRALRDERRWLEATL